MNCPNCGLAHPDSAKFCANCGTPLNAAGSPPNQQQNGPQYAPPGAYQPGPYQTPQAPPPAGNALAKNIGIGCLIVIVIFLFFGLSCTRACFRFGHRTYLHRHYY